MPPLPTDRRGRALAELVAREQYERGLAARVEEILRAAFREATQQFAADGEGVTLRDRRRLADLATQLAATIGVGYHTAATLTARELAAYAALEADLAAGDLAALAGEISVVAASPLSRARAAAIARLPALIDGLSLGAGWTDLAARASAAARRAVQMGMALGETPDVIVRRILPRGAVAAGDTPAVWNGSRSQARTFVRTALASVQNAAAMATYEAAGPRVSEEYQLLAVRDARTTKICAALDGLRFRYDDPQRKVPPFHLNCRTTCLALPNWAALGLKPPGSGDPRTAPLTFDSFDTWLRAQSATTQDAILGPTRGAWYRAGTMGLRQLVDEDDRVLTLPQLRARLGLG